MWQDMSIAPKTPISDEVYHAGAGPSIIVDNGERVGEAFYFYGYGDCYDDGIVDEASGIYLEYSGAWRWAAAGSIGCWEEMSPPPLRWYPFPEPVR